LKLGLKLEFETLVQPMEQGKIRPFKTFNSFYRSWPSYV